MQEEKETTNYYMAGLLVTFAFGLVEFTGQDRKYGQVWQMWKGTRVHVIRCSFYLKSA